MNLSKKKKFAILAAAISLNFSQVSASDTEYLYYNGEKFVNFEFFNEGEFASQYTLSNALKNATKSATSYWTNILAPRSQFSSAWQILVITESNFQNASATTNSFFNQEEVSDNYVAQMLQGKLALNSFDAKILADVDPYGDDTNENLPEGNVAFSMIQIGQYFGANRTGAVDGWWVDTDTVLPTNEQSTDFVGTFRHELGHALGIGLLAENCDWNGNTLDDSETPVTFGENDFVLSKFADDITDENSWALHLIDKNGNKAKPGMMIITSDAFEDIKSENPSAVESDYFIVDNENFAYFVGENVTSALGGATFNGVSGLPVNAWESDSIEGEDYEDISVKKFEGSHLQTAGMMSHRSYSNYTTFMEVELAAMQDLGYDFDRKAYYGYSIYGNGNTINNTNGYSARNSEGTAYTSSYSKIPLGVGLHIYGSNNNVTQSADILTRGTGAVGIRIDGENNTVTIPKNIKIRSDGSQGKGVLISYGRNQNLNLNGTVTAKGNGGNAVEFNFGSSTNGAFDEYRGSYIRYRRTVDGIDGKLDGGFNQNIIISLENYYNSSANELNGEMVTDFNISGKISGGENAIYIGRNAFVKNINVNSGSKISGNITSDWKHFSEDYGFYTEKQETDFWDIAPLYLQYNDSYYLYTEYVPDLVTNLNFNANATYGGNITGVDNIKLNVTAGTLNYSGVADVVNVNVAQDAKLFGGTFTVNDMSANLSADFTDDTTGKFYNHGTISNLTINGNLISDGILSDEVGKITVNGSANVNNSTIFSVSEIAPNESAEILNATKITGTLANSEENPTKISGLIGGYGEISGKKINYKTKISNNIGNLNPEQNEAFNAVKNLSNSLTGEKKSELTPLYSLTSENAGIALSEIGNSTAAKMITAAQQSTVANKVISDRLTTAFSMSTFNFNAGGLNFADGGENILMGVSADYPAEVDNNFWVKFTKNRGELKGGADYHGSAISGGYDRAFGENWRGGLFVSYNATSLSTNNSGGNIYDTRGGIYFGYHNDIDDSFLYIDAGKIRNKLNRSISTLGISTNAKYNSNVFEVGGEYKRNLTPGQIWNVSPFINLQYSHLNQDAYSETGAGIFNQHVNSDSNDYFAGQFGVEFKRVLSHGNFAARIGVKHAFCGADPELNFSYEGDENNFYTLKNNQNKTHFILSIGGENEFAKGWIIGGDVGFQRGERDKDLSASVMLRKVW